MPRVSSPPSPARPRRRAPAVPPPAASDAPSSSGGKVLPLEELSAVLEGQRAEGKAVVMCHGVFDLLHIGHIRHFAQARAMGDVLVVTVTPDRFVNKGAHRPAFPEQLRAEAIAALDAVDYVAINRWPTSTETIRMLRPAVYCKGSEYRQVEGDALAALNEEIAAAEAVGGRIAYTEDITFSSSSLINAYVPMFSPEAERWLKAFRTRYSAEQVLGFLARLSGVRPLVVGEAIIDEYVFCDGLGKSTKDPVLAFRYASTETYAGGSLAVANHLAGFCREVELVTVLGESDRAEEFVRRSLKPNVVPRFVTWRQAPTIHKRRFVDTHTSAKMFEIYLMQDGCLAGETEAELVSALQETCRDADLAIVADYGHGMLTPAAIRTLCGQAKFLAVNTQANAGNRGFNTVSKYPRADYVCLAMHEVALETRMRHAPWQDLVQEVVKRIDCPRFTVTQGKEGSMHYTRAEGFTEVPAFATKVTDRVGAGDAVLAVTSPLVAQGAPWDVVGFLGNLAGAEMVAELGNRISVSGSSLSRHVTSLMK
jgi:rfaE bifunctional protein nucleotidyltransferase chain/domain